MAQEHYETLDKKLGFSNKENEISLIDKMKIGTLKLIGTSPYKLEDIKERAYGKSLLKTMSHERKELDQEFNNYIGVNISIENKLKTLHEKYCDTILESLDDSDNKDFKEQISIVRGHSDKVFEYIKEGYNLSEMLNEKDLDKNPIAKTIADIENSIMEGDKKYRENKEKIIETKKIMDAYDFVMDEIKRDLSCRCNSPNGYVKTRVLCKEIV